VEEVRKGDLVPVRLVTHENVEDGELVDEGDQSEKVDGGQIYQETVKGSSEDDKSHF